MCAALRTRSPLLNDRLFGAARFDGRPGTVYRSGGAFASSIAAVAQFRIERRQSHCVATSHCALSNPPAARGQQRAVLPCANADFYNLYPWGASFCTLSEARLVGGSTALLWRANSSIP